MDASIESTPTAIDPFDLDVLHQIVIRMDPADLTRLRDETRLPARVPCEIVFDGVRLPRSGIRDKGVSSRQARKPAFSIKFDEFVPGQKLAGLDKILLNNAAQDDGLLNEHVAYTLFRMAGVPAPRTAHGLVTVNDKVMGLYVVREAIERTFLARAFGAGFAGGNLYEGGGDFVPVPWAQIIDLKHEKEEMRSRANLVALAGLVSAVSDADFAAQVGTKLDLDAFMTAHAVMAVLGNIDSYVYNSNNYYLYENPRDGRFILIPHGADELFDPTGGPPPYDFNPSFDPLKKPDEQRVLKPGRLAVRLRHVPALDMRFTREVARVIRDVWNVGQLNALLDRAAQNIRTGARAGNDLATFESHLPRFRERLTRRKTFVESRLR